jgi:hypothetical protein
MLQQFTKGEHLLPKFDSKSSKQEKESSGDKLKNSGV